jgi:hypothetical protein
MRNNCHICRATNSVAVRYREKSIISMCPKCIGECSAYATINCFGNLYDHMKKCIDEGKTFKRGIKKMEDDIWLESFSNWIEMNRRR